MTSPDIRQGNMGARKPRQGIISNYILEVGHRSFINGQNEKRGYMRTLEAENRLIREEIRNYQRNGKERLERITSECLPVI
jgi:predicted phage-related endonuclease